MIERILETDAQRLKFCIDLGGEELPVTVKVTSGRSRTVDQNRLLWQWIMDARRSEPYRGWTAEDIRNHWKLRFGIPILCNDNDVFAAAWIRAELKLTSQEQLRMVELIDVTSIMTVPQMKQFLDAIWEHSLDEGIRLTDTEEHRYAAQEADAR